MYVCMYVCSVLNILMVYLMSLNKKYDKVERVFHCCNKKLLDYAEAE